MTEETADKNIQQHTDEQQQQEKEKQVYLTERHYYNRHGGFLRYLRFYLRGYFHRHVLERIENSKTPGNCCRENGRI